MWKQLALILALAAAPLATANADTLTVGQAKTTALADWYANIHYAAMEETCEVVITLAPGADAAEGITLELVQWVDSDSDQG
jgi:hypothetical protein